MNALLQIAKEFNLKIIVDCAQAPGAMYGDRKAGTLGDIGIYSLNRHKNIQCGEGGIAVTNDSDLALRMQLIRNHGENLVEFTEWKPKSIVNILGFNFRMTEVEAAIAIEQLRKLDKLNAGRIALAKQLENNIKVDGLKMPAIRKNCDHVYYMQIMLFDEAAWGISREKFVTAIRAEGIPIWGGYLKPLYLAPLYQQKIAIGSEGFPFKGAHYDGTVSYAKGLCPIAERLFEKETIVNAHLYPPLEKNDMSDISNAIHKIFEQRRELIN
jgi:perosamine synthetase